MIPLLRGQRQAHSPSAGTAESQMPSPLLSWGIGRAATLLKTLLQYYGKSLEALPGVAYPAVWDNRSTLNTKTGYDDTHTRRRRSTIPERENMTDRRTEMLYQYSVSALLCYRTIKIVYLLLAAVAITTGVLYVSSL